MLKLGVRGKILTGKYAGWYVLIELHQKEIKGQTRNTYYLYESQDPQMAGAYDTWFMDYAIDVQRVSHNCLTRS